MVNLWWDPGKEPRLFRVQHVIRLFYCVVIVLVALWLELALTLLWTVAALVHMLDSLQSHAPLGFLLFSAESDEGLFL